MVDFNVYSSGVLVKGIALNTAGGAASASGLLMGIGTSSDPATSSTAGDKFVELRCKNSATSGDNRLAYLRFELSGAAGNGECLRAFTKATAALDTVRGAHISLDLSSAGSVTGLGVGLTGQLVIADALPAGGQYFAGMSEIYCAASSSIAAPSKHAIHSFNTAGNATAAALVRNLFHIGSVAVDGGTDTDHMVTTGTADIGLATNLTAALRIIVNSTNYWIPLATSIAAD